MATEVEQPSDPEEPLLVTVTVWNILYWLWSVVQFFILIVFPYKDIDAKLGLLVGDDVKRTMTAGWLPGWAANIAAKFGEMQRVRIQDGALGRYNFISDSADQYRWTG